MMPECAVTARRVGWPDGTIARMAAKNRQASGTPATALLSREGVEFTVHTYDHDPAAASYGREAADAMGVEPERVFKTLVADVDGELTVAVVPVSGSLDLKALATAVGGKKAAMADPAAVTRTTGYVLGGVSPLGQRKQLPTVVDETALLVRHRVLLGRQARHGDRAGARGAGAADRRGGGGDRAGRDAGIRQARPTSGLRLRRRTSTLVPRSTA